jgi:hypothetical protein
MYYDQLTSTDDSINTSENVLPEPIKCDQTQVTTTDENLIKLAACRDTANCALNVIKYNNLVNQYNNEQDLLFQAAHQAWANRKEIVAKNHAMWSTDKNKNYATLTSDIVKGGCQAAGDCNHSSCPSGRVKDGSMSGLHYNCNIGCCKSGCRTNCKWSQSSIDSKMAEWEVQHPEPFFTEPEPSQIDYPHAEQNTTHMDIQCCSNYIDITGSASDVTQSCIQTIDQRVIIEEEKKKKEEEEKKKKEEEEEEKKGEEEEEKKKEEETEEEEIEKKNNNMIYIIILIFAIILIIILLFLSFWTISKKKIAT